MYIQKLETIYLNHGVSNQPGVILGHRGQIWIFTTKFFELSVQHNTIMQLIFVLAWISLRSLIYVMHGVLGHHRITWGHSTIGQGSCRSLQRHNMSSFICFTIIYLADIYIMQSMYNPIMITKCPIDMHETNGIGKSKTFISFHYVPKIHCDTYLVFCQKCFKAQCFFILHYLCRMSIRSENQHECQNSVVKQCEHRSMTTLFIECFCTMC